MGCVRVCVGVGCGCVGCVVVCAIIVVFSLSLEVKYILKITKLEVTSTK